MSEATDLARAHAPEAISALVTVIRDPDSKGSEVVAASNALLDRGYGKPMQAIINVPVSPRLGARLAALDDAALLAVIESSKILPRGVHTQNGSDPRGVENGRSTQTQLPPPLLNSPTGGASNSKPGGTRKSKGRVAPEITDAEFVPVATPKTPFEKFLDDPLLA